MPSKSWKVFGGKSTAAWAEWGFLKKFPSSSKADLRGLIEIAPREQLRKTWKLNDNRDEAGLNFLYLRLVAAACVHETPFTNSPLEFEFQNFLRIDLFFKDHWFFLYNNNNKQNVTFKEEVNFICFIVSRKGRKNYRIIFFILKISLLIWNKNFKNVNPSEIFIKLNFLFLFNFQESLKQ